jgi:hypothetical protein
LTVTEPELALEVGTPEIVGKEFGLRSPVVPRPPGHSEILMGSAAENVSIGVRLFTHHRNGNCYCHAPAESLHDELNFEFVREHRCATRGDTRRDAQAHVEGLPQSTMDAFHARPWKANADELPDTFLAGERRGIANGHVWKFQETPEIPVAAFAD